MDNDQVSNFALQMLEAESRGPAVASNEVVLHPTPSFLPTHASEQAPDISEVQVPQDFIQSIMENVDALVEEVAPVSDSIANPTPPVAQQSVVESGELVELASLIMEVKVVLQEVKQALTEMTTVGGGLGAPAPSKTSDEDSKLEKSLSKILSKRRASSKR